MDFNVYKEFLKVTNNDTLEFIDSVLELLADFRQMLIIKTKLYKQLKELDKKTKEKEKDKKTSKKKKEEELKIFD